MTELKLVRQGDYLGGLCDVITGVLKRGKREGQKSEIQPKGDVMTEALGSRFRERRCNTAGFEDEEKSSQSRAKGCRQPLEARQANRFPLDPPE